MSEVAAIAAARRLGPRRPVLSPECVANALVADRLRTAVWIRPVLTAPAAIRRDFANYARRSVSRCGRSCRVGAHPGDPNAYRLKNVKRESPRSLQAHEAGASLTKFFYRPGEERRAPRALVAQYLVEHGQELAHATKATVGSLIHAASRP
ncbi:hypothetical protein WMF26_01090 [Sorangium sp. So ce185]|uniref:hypothetical protein n=1 Tax=Sorangium sp. So ce185 TaxID=3133287 RepID=UPI003F5F03C9